MPATQINPAFLDVMFIRGNHIDSFTLPYVAYLGDGASLKVVPYEAHGNYM